MELAFFIFCGVAIIIEGIIIAAGRPGAAMIVLVALGVTLQKWFGVPVTSYLPNSTAGVVALITVYVAIGAAWSVFRFYVAYKNKMRELAEKKSSWITDRKKMYPNDSPEDISAAWNKHVDLMSPAVSSMKADIFAWFSAWPLSVIHYFFHNLLHDFFNWLYDIMASVYESIAERLRNDIKD